MSKPTPSTEATTLEPPAIHRLDETLINRIAAGEIIHRPASALKELLENSLDAGATSIRVTVRDGGLKLLQIQDNGCGIKKSDLPILAERFTTSKLSTFTDLSSLTTYGFRGEALASISHVAHLSVTTKTRQETCAWKAYYLNGVMVPAKPGQTAEPKACAGNDGTTITAEDLFYNTPSRLSALRSSSEEYARILDVMTRYAVHNSGVSFVCKKEQSVGPELSTPAKSTTQQAIKLLYGHSIAKELMTCRISSNDKESAAPQDGGSDEPNSAEDTFATPSWSAQIYFTNANYQGKKTVFLLFINHRLVESSRIKKALENTYGGVLPKGTFPFIYMSLNVDPRDVDVNVHPTKREVHFLDEDTVTDRVANAMQNLLVAQNSSKVFDIQTQTSLTDGLRLANTSSYGKDGQTVDSHPEGQKKRAHENNQSQSSKGEGSSKSLVYNKVRTSLKDRTLESMFPVVNPSQMTEVFDDSEISSVPKNTFKVRAIHESECYLASVNSLRKAIVKGRHTFLTELLDKHIYVGLVDLDRSLSLIQHSTKLYLVNHGALAEELFYQLGLRQFGNIHRIKLDPPPSIRTLIGLAVKAEKSLKVSHSTQDEQDQIVDKIVAKISSRAPMLDDYFSMRINRKGELESLPLLLRDYSPNLDKLPLFLMRLGPQVAWTSEKECFSTFLRELAYFYRPGSNLISAAAAGADEKLERWQIEHVVFPYLRKYLIAPKTLLDHDIVQVASLPDLYRVFERC